jgi:uncharacterized GH25 family protein
MRLAFALLLCTLFAHAALAHDTWVQTNTNLVRTGDAIHIDLMLGNHGNEHRDFKLASKVSLETCTLEVISPDGERYDIKPQLADLGYAPKEGFWSSRFITGEAGLHTVAHTADAVNHGVRGIKSGKTFFVASDSLDNVSAENPGFDKPLGHALELVPTANTVTPMGPGLPIRVKVLYHGKPLAEARVSFIPRGEELSEGFDSTYERLTDADGAASFIPKEGNIYLVVVHHEEPEQRGEGYQSTKYSATLVVFVPQICPCCGG